MSSAYHRAIQKQIQYHNAAIMHPLANHSSHHTTHPLAVSAVATEGPRRRYSPACSRKALACAGRPRTPSSVASFGCRRACTGSKGTALRARCSRSWRASCKKSISYCMSCIGRSAFRTFLLLKKEREKKKVGHLLRLFYVVFRTKARMSRARAVEFARLQS